MSADRFMIRWDLRMGCYRVSEPNIEGPTEVVRAELYDRAVEALEKAYQALTRLEDLGPDCSEEAVEIAREALGAPLVEVPRG